MMGVAPTRSGAGNQVQAMGSDEYPEMAEPGGLG
jgi:hypothetical protein